MARARAPSVNTARGLTWSYGERLFGFNPRTQDTERTQRLGPKVQAVLSPPLEALESLSERDRRVQPADRRQRAGEQSTDGAAESGEASEHADRVDLHAAAGRPAKFLQEPGRGLLCTQLVFCQKLLHEFGALFPVSFNSFIQQHLANLRNSPLLFVCDALDFSPQRRIDSKHENTCSRHS
jgi:hypothetical protein